MRGLQSWFCDVQCIIKALTRDNAHGLKWPGRYETASAGHSGPLTAPPEVRLSLLIVYSH